MGKEDFGLVKEDVKEGIFRWRILQTISFFQMAVRDVFVEEYASDSRN